MLGSVRRGKNRLSPQYHSSYSDLLQMFLADSAFAAMAALLWLSGAAKILFAVLLACTNVISCHIKIQKH